MHKMIKRFLALAVLACSAAAHAAGGGVEADEVGRENAGSTVLSATPKPPKTAGEKITDEGDGGSKIAEYLVSQKII